MERDHMKDLRRYLALKYIQYLVLSSSNAVSTLLGLLGSAYTMILLHSAKVSSKSTAVLISSLAQADILVFLSLVLGGFGVSSLPRVLLVANAHLSCVLLSCVALEAYLITFLPSESRPHRTVSNARLLSRGIWVLVAAECALFLLDERLRASAASAPSCSARGLLLQLSSTATALLQSLSYILGILLRIVNVYIYYKIFFSMSPRSRLKSK
ncbi:PREDICTED: lysophosphatidic acid receptor 4-like isoform X2 [Ficedula albicollis]|nr:PREDICTED: lysophosphatidic acid receptor 4-like isoform X2 [Ficedula albicollis]